MTWEKPHGGEFFNTEKQRRHRDRRGISIVYYLSVGVTGRLCAFGCPSDPRRNVIKLTDALAVIDALRLLTRTSLRSFCPLFRGRKRGRKATSFPNLKTLEAFSSIKALNAWYYTYLLPNNDSAIK